MTPRKGLSIRSRMRAIIVVTSAAALVLAGAVFLAYDFWSFRQNTARRLEVLARVFGLQVNAALAFDDARDAAETLRTLEGETRVAAACVYRKDGTPFARYLRADWTRPLPPAPGADGAAFVDGHLHVFQPVSSDDGRIGTLYVRSDLRESGRRFRINLAIVALIILGSVGAAYLLSATLERLITAPIFHLGQTVQDVSAGRDYSRRASKARQDELGDLVDGFNDMLSQIQVRDEALQSARHDLERRVEERTAELTSTNEELHREMARHEHAKAELAERARQQAVVADLGRRALAGTDVQEIMNDAAARVTETLRVQYARILEVRPPGGALLFRAGSGWGPDAAGTSLASPEAMLQAHQVVSSINIPIQGEGETYGLLGAHSSEARSFTPDDVNFLRAVANVLASVLQRARAEEVLRVSEERHRRLVELSPDAILIQIDDRFVYLNPAAQALFRASRPEDLLGTSVMDRIHPDFREVVRERIDRIRNEGTEVPLLEEKLLRLDGTVVDAEVIATPFLFDEKPGVQVILRDITQRKEMERLKREFVSVVSHELRTPLTSIHGSLGLVAHGVVGELPASARPLVDIAYKNCQRLVRLINDILDLEKCEAGKMTFDFREVEISSVVRQAVEDTRAYGAQLGVPFVLEGEGAGAWVRGDSDRLIQVFTNLLSNAAKFSPRGEPVTVSVTRTEDRVRIEVADRGPGIPEEFRGRIFQKFAQADSSDIRQKGGTGLGLAICKNIVEKHGGRIGFRSEPGRGTAFFVDLPGLAEPTKPPGGIVVSSASGS